MSLIVIDTGYRIQTPVESEFPPGGINALTATKAAHSSTGTEQQVDADGDRFTALLESEQHNRQRAKAQNEQPLYEKPKEANQKKPHGIIAEQIMTEPVQVIPVGSSLQTAWDRMQALNIGHLIVVDTEEKPVGIISQSDVREHGKASVASISTYYTKQMIAASPETEASIIANAFIEHQINAVPIFNSDDTLVGIVTRTDLLRLIITGAHLERWA